MNLFFRYDWPAKELLRYTASYALLPAFLVFLPVAGHVLLPDFIGPATLKLIGAFMTTDLVTYVGTLALLAGSLSLLGSANSRWFNLCKVVNVGLMSIAFQLIGAMIGVCFSLLLVAGLAGLSVRGALGSILALAIMLTAMFFTGKVVFGKTAHLHTCMFDERKLRIFVAIVLTLFLLWSLLANFRP